MREKNKSSFSHIVVLTDSGWVLTGAEYHAAYDAGWEILCPQYNIAIGYKQRIILKNPCPLLFPSPQRGEMKQENFITNTES